MADGGRHAGRVAIVTGGASGIGLAIAKRLAAEGAHVVVADLDAAKARGVAEPLGGLGVACDVSDPAAVEACAAAAVARFGSLDVVVNNAGLMTFAAIADTDADAWLRVLRVDLVGAAMFTREAFRRGAKAIVNVASVHAVETSPNAAPYAAAKAGLLSLTRTTAIEGKAKGLRANAVLPGAIDTPMLWSNPNVKSGAEHIDPADVGKPEDIAAAVAFLASDDAHFVTGASLAVDGGRLAAL